ncbi:MAG: hypothetical protein NC200_05705, partial [Candidatus Gastranaerophilales bacterium]|nr:hypothetical protein [Candidatus Gastranaerophilales bacterium]
MNIKEKILKYLKEISEKQNKKRLLIPAELIVFAKDIADLQLNKLKQKLDGFLWLHSEYLATAYDDKTFSYKNNIFSIIVDIQDESGKSYLSKDVIKRQIKAAKKYNWIPCRFPVVVKDAYDSDFSKMHSKTSRWNLYHTITNEEINPENYDEKKVEMSDWELHNFAIKYMARYLQAKHCAILSFQDALEIDPQIWFNDAAGNRSFLIVRCARFSKDNIKKPKNL